MEEWVGGTVEHRAGWDMVGGGRKGREGGRGLCSLNKEFSNFFIP